MNYPQTQKLCAWSGLAALGIFFAALLIAQFLPIPSPALTQEQVVAMYQGNTTGIRIGMLMILICSVLFVPFVGVISIHLRRIEGGTPIMAYIQLSAGTVGILIFNIPAVIWLAASFRMERAPELIYLINDLGWILLVIDWPPFAVQFVAIAIAILHDKSATPIFPRWLGFFHLWVAVLSVPGSLIPFFKTGPFAWNGVFGFWLPAVAFGVWVLVLTVMLLKAIEQQDQHK